jgi:hypothetical protein
LPCGGDGGGGGSEAALMVVVVVLVVVVVVVALVVVVVVVILLTGSSWQEWQFVVWSSSALFFTSILISRFNFFSYCCNKIIVTLRSYRVST